LAKKFYNAILNLNDIAKSSQKKLKYLFLDYPKYFRGFKLEISFLSKFLRGFWMNIGDRTNNKTKKIGLWVG